MNSTGCWTTWCCAYARYGTPWCCPTTGLHSLAKGTGRHFGAGGVRQTMVEMDDGFLFVAAAGDGSCLAVLTSVTADIGLVAYEMARLVKRVGEHLYTPTRSGARPPAAG